MPEINVTQIVEEVKGSILELQAVNDERAEQLKKTGEDIAELQVKQKELAEDLDKKVANLEKVTAQISAIQNVKPEDEEYTARFNKSLEALKKASGRAFTAMSGDEIKAYNSALKTYVTMGEKALTDEERKAINTANDAQGGYLVVPEIASGLVNKRFDGYGLYEVCGKRNTAGNYEVLVDFADYDEAYMNKETVEDATLSDGEDYARISFKNDVIKYGKKFSRVALEDTFTNVEADVLGKMRGGMTRTIGEFLTNGKGGAYPRGILTYPNGKKFGQIEQIESSVSGILTFKDVISTIPASLKDGYHANASYLMRRQTFFGLLAEADTTGKLQISDMVNLFSAQGLSLNILGYGVNFDAGMPQVAGGALAVAFGDFGEGYILTTTPTLGVVRDDTHPDFVKIWQRERHDGKVVNFEAIKLLKIKA